MNTECKACKGSGKLYNEKDPFTCPYCKGTGKRNEPAPHPSHKMGKWHSEIIAPCGTPRFYAVRKCKLCGEEEWKHSAGHFLHGLTEKCRNNR